MAGYLLHVSHIYHIAEFYFAVQNIFVGFVYFCCIGLDNLHFGILPFFSKTAKPFDFTCASALIPKINSKEMIMKFFIANCSLLMYFISDSPTY